MPAYLEHVNVNASDPEVFAKLLCELFGWKLRWSGATSDGRYGCHVGGDGSYVAIFAADDVAQATGRYSVPGEMNHFGVVVDDLDAMETRVKAAGYKPELHADYEPGRRFYFNGPDRIQIEVVSYTG